MIVSTFELRPGSIAQHYCLTISNLEDTNIKTGLAIKIADKISGIAITPENIAIKISNRTTNSRTLLFTSVISGGIITITASPFKIPSFETVQVSLFASEVSMIRGYVILNNYESRPKRVLLTPELKISSSRAVRIQDNADFFHSLSFVDVSHFTYALPISSGKAENIIDPS